MAGERLVAFDQVVVPVLKSLERKHFGGGLVQTPVVSTPGADDDDVGKEGDALLVSNAVAGVGPVDVRMRLLHRVALKDRRAAVSEVAYFVAGTEHGLQLGRVLLHADRLRFAVVGRVGVAVCGLLTDAGDLDGCRRSSAHAGPAQGRCQEEGGSRAPAESRSSVKVHLFSHRAGAVRPPPSHRNLSISSIQFWSTCGYSISHRRAGKECSRCLRACSGPRPAPSISNRIRPSGKTRSCPSASPPPARVDRLRETRARRS